MAIYKGIINLLGTGRVHKDTSIFAVIEIGGMEIKNVEITDYLKSYLAVGEQLEVLVLAGRSPFKKQIYAIKTHSGKVIKEGLGPALTGLALFGGGGAFSLTQGYMVLALVLMLLAWPSFHVVLQTSKFK
jgi:hypothetical protein